MKYFRVLAICLLLQLGWINMFAQDDAEGEGFVIVPAAERVDQYFELLQGKRIALVVNRTSMIGNASLPDSLRSLGLDILKLFVPEHGYKGTEDAGADIESSVDDETKMEIVSLYGKTKKPTAEQLESVDAVVYDIQDVGTRFYTYISTLQYVMEACAENGKELIILDRPNPNGHYVDGPVMQDTSLHSFVGMQPIPIVYGMTPGEYAQMLKGEKWIPKAEKLTMTVILCDGYTHRRHYKLPVQPSPNLKNMNAIYLYPSLCFFEGTVVSVGRGTERPFEQWGHPKYPSDKFKWSFTPVPMEGGSKPLLEGQECFGRALFSEKPDGDIRSQIELRWLIEAYNAYPEKKKFFVPYFENLAGTKELRKQIESKKSEAVIRESWKKNLDVFKTIRRKYLLYEDFE